MTTQKRAGPRRSHLDLAERLLRADATGGAPSSVIGHLPSTADIAHLGGQFISLYFPETNGADGRTKEHVAAALLGVEGRLEEAVFLGLHRRCNKPEARDACRKKAAAVTGRLLDALPEIRSLLLKDVQAALDSDPAAKGVDEIVACYPGLYAISIYRTAHRLLREGAEIIPRMLTEHAKSRTGIDIHPGARIGSSFFIDHGTGIVIGETADIGNNVRMYQGVTLGALSVKRKHGAPALPGDGRNKRHPTIEDDVVIYGNATILGGQTVIGRGAVVGGNAWITYSVPAGIKVGVAT